LQRSRPPSIECAAAPLLVMPSFQYRPLDEAREEIRLFEPEHLEEADSPECADSDLAMSFLGLDAARQSQNRKSKSTSVDHGGAETMAEYRKYAESELIGEP
jgi:hypothetical protein